MKLLFWLFVVASLSLEGADQFTRGKAGIALNGHCSFEDPGISPEAGTIQCWFRCDREEKGAMLFSCGNDSPDLFFCKVEHDRIIVGIRSKKGVFRIESAPFQQTELWHHLVINWGIYKDKPFLNIYLDGEGRTHAEDLKFPDRFGPGKLCIGCNSAYRKVPSFSGQIDEFAVWNIALDNESIMKLYQTGLAGKPLDPGQGCILYASFDHGFELKKGDASDSDSARKMLRRASRKFKIKKYPDELEFTYSSDRYIAEKVPGTLNDGRDDTRIWWKNMCPEITCMLQHTSELRKIEIVAGKITKAYFLEEIQISLDNGSGEFGTPYIIQAYGEDPSKTLKKIDYNIPIDETCRTYYYCWENPGRAARVKIKVLGVSHMSLSEIRIIGVPFVK